MAKGSPPVSICLALSALLAGVHAVSPQNGPKSEQGPSRKPEFEVVSIRPDGKDVGISYASSPDGFEATGQTLTSLILLAYLPMPMWNGDRVKNAPGWALAETYTIRAKVGADDLVAWRGSNAKECRKSMIQSLLAERFHLRAHTEPMETKGFALVRVRESSSLKPAAPGEVLPKYTPLSEGVVRFGKDPGGAVLTFYGATMKSLAGFLTPGSHTTVEDQTGLQGGFTFDLHRIRPTGPDRGMEISDPAEKWDLGPLGLKTKTIKIPSLAIFVDHAEHPSPN